MEAIQTQEAVDLARVPGPVQAEFGKRDFDSKTKGELAAMETQINNLLGGNATAPQTQVAPASVFEPSAFQAPAPVTQTPAPVQPPVPAKFANPDGTLNEQKLEKSYVSLEQYLEKERELTRLKQPQPPAYQPNPYQQPAPQYAPPRLEDQVNTDMRVDPGATVLNIARAAMMQAQATNEAANTELRRRLELMEMGQKDPAVFTAQGLEQITKTLTDNPWLWNSPTPYMNAYKMTGPITPRIAQGVQQAPSVQRTAPILPGGQAPTGIPQAAQSFSTETDLRRALEQKFPKDPAKQMAALEQYINNSMARG